MTIAKISEYWRFVTIGFLVDCIGVLFSFYVLPFIAMAFGLGLIVVESKSMFEHARRRKSHTTELPDILASIVAATHEKDAEAVVKRLTEVITEQDKAPKKKANHDTV